MIASRRRFLREKPLFIDTWGELGPQSFDIRPGGLCFVRQKPPLDDLIGMDDPGLDRESVDRWLAQQGLVRVSTWWWDTFMVTSAPRTD